MNRTKWWFKVYWSLYTGLAFKVPSWKYREIDLYLAEFIIFTRMRHDLMEEGMKDKKPMSVVMFDNKPIEVVA